MGQPPANTNNQIQTELSRDLGLGSTLAIGAGTMIAAGIFTLSGLAVAQVGSAAIVSFVLAAAVAALTALTYCEFTSIYPESGEGYLYARKTFAPPLAYMVGWCLLLGYASSCAFYIASLSSYFNEFILNMPIEQLSGLAVLLGLTLLNIKGTKETGLFQIVITTVKIGLLLWFVSAGLGRVDTDAIIAEFKTDIPKIASTAALVFVTFFGFSAIAAAAGEVRNPTRTVPRAIFLSMGIVTVLYVLVILVIIAADLSEYTEAAMGRAAEDFLGPIGGMVIVLGALFSMLSASNASVLAGSRIALSMSRLGHLPREIGTINAKTRTPAVALVLVGAGITAFALILPLEGLAHFADCVLLVALTLVNLSLIQHRRKYPDMKRPFRVPLVPVLPGLGIVANIYLLVQIPLQGHIEPVALAVFALVGGFLGFLAWKGTQAEAVAISGQPSRVALERSTAAESRFRVLVPIANPANVSKLIDLAASVAKPRDGEIVVLRVVVVPEQLPPALEEAHVEDERQLLERARAQSLERGVPASSLVRVGHNLAKAILETSHQRDCDLILLGWKGHTSSAARILGSDMDQVVTHARADIMLVKLVGENWPLKRLLLPTAGGEHARCAEVYAADIAAAHDGSLTLCSVMPPTTHRPDLVAEDDRLRKARSRMPQIKNVKTEVLLEDSPVPSIIEEADGYDAVVVGASEQSFSSKVMFGSIPERIARDLDRPVIVIKHHHPVKALVGRVMSE